MTEVSTPRKTIAEVQKFAVDWTLARAHAKPDDLIPLAEEFFGVRAMRNLNGVVIGDLSAFALLGVVMILCAACVGDLEILKQEMRSANGNVLEWTRRLLGHLSHFKLLVRVEILYRDGKLRDDWSLVRNAPDELAIKFAILPEYAELIGDSEETDDT